MLNLSYRDVLEEISPPYVNGEDNQSMAASIANWDHTKKIVGIVDEIEADIRESFSQPPAGYSKSANRQNQKEALNKYYEHLIKIAEQLQRGMSSIVAGNALRLTAFAAAKGGNAKKCKNIIKAFNAVADATLKKLEQDRDTILATKIGELGLQALDFEGVLHDKDYKQASSRYSMFRLQCAEDFSCASAVLTGCSSAARQLRARAIENLHKTAECNTRNYLCVLFRIICMAENSRIYPGAESLLRETYAHTVKIINNDISERAKYEISDNLRSLVHDLIGLDVGIIAVLSDRPNVEAMAVTSFKNHVEMLKTIDPRGTPDFLQDALKAALDPVAGHKGSQLGVSKALALLEVAIRETKAQKPTPPRRLSQHMQQLMSSSSYNCIFPKSGALSAENRLT